MAGVFARLGVVHALSTPCPCCGYYRCSYCGHCHNPSCDVYDASCIDSCCCEVVYVSSAS